MKSGFFTWLYLVFSFIEQVCSIAHDQGKPDLNGIHGDDDPS